MESPSQPSTGPLAGARAFAHRYAPFLVIGGLLAGLLVAAPSRPLRDSDSLAGGTGVEGFGPGTSGEQGQVPAGVDGSGAPVAGGAPGTPTAPGSSPTTPGAVGTPGGAAGTAPASRGTTALPCLPRKFNAALPCKPGWAGTDNGGATSKHVTRDRVVIAYYIPYSDESARAIRAQAGTDYTPEQIRADLAVLQKYVRANWQTYGRRIDVVPYFGTHPVTDDAGMKAEAVEIDQQVKAFAVVAASTPIPLADELSRRKVIVWNTYQQLDNYYIKNAPYQYSVFGDASLLNAFTVEYVAKRLKGRTADFAGQGVVGKKRVFGFCYEQIQEPAAKDLIARLKRAGIEPVVATYGSDASQAQQQALSIVTQFRQAGVTTVINLGNPVGPIFLTANADSQGYNPEYLVAGFAGVDLEEAARLYTQTQWAHAFGFTQVTVRNEFEDSQGYGASKLADPGHTPTKFVINAYLNLQQIANGLETAGPGLNPAAFQRGLGSIPATVGDPKAPSLSYGSRGPGPFTGRDDVAEIWWDPNETETFDGNRGAYIRVNGGKRVRLGTFPNTSPAVFR